MERISLTIDGTEYVAIPRDEYQRLIGSTPSAAPGLAGKDAVAYARESLAAKLKALRVGAKLSQAELAKRLGVTQANIANVEASRGRVGLKAVTRWEAACR